MLVKAFGLPAALLPAVQAAWPSASFVAEGSTDCDAVLVWDGAADEVAAFVAANPRLRWVHMRASGVPLELVEALRGRDVVLTTGRGTHGAAVAEHVVGLLLAHYKRFGALVRAQQERAWRVPSDVDELRGKTVGLLGLGDLGRSTARLLTAFGTTVLGLRRTGEPVPEVSTVYGPAQLDEFLGRLDVLVVAAPLTPETTGLIGAKQLRMLPVGTVLVNVGRGTVVDPDALVDAVRDGHLGGALLDVFDTEPLPPDSPLWHLPGVLITPHCADTTAQTDQRCLAQLLRLIEENAGD